MLFLFLSRELQSGSGELAREPNFALTGAGYCWRMGMADPSLKLELQKRWGGSCVETMCLLSHNHIHRELLCYICGHHLRGEG